MYLTKDNIRIENLEKRVSSQENGAVLTFLGTVRAEQHAEFGPLVQLEYEAYEPMAEKVIGRIEREIQSRLEVSVAIQHRLGPIKIGEISVAIAVGSPHRDEAYRASREAIEAIKHMAPIWKREVWERGATWSEGCQVHVGKGE